MSEYVTDPDLLAKLNAPEEPKKSTGEYVTDPDLLAKLNEPEGPVAPETTAGNNIAQMAAPALSQLPGAGINYQEVYNNVVKPVATGIGAGVGSFVKNPVGGLVDVGAMHLGLPPPNAIAHSWEAAKNVYQGAKTAAENAGNYLNSIPDADRETFYKIWDGLKTDDKARFGSAIESQGANAIQSFELPDYAARNPEVAAAFNTLKSQAPGIGTKVARVVAPVLNTAGRALGAAGMGYNLYQAHELANQTQLGQRLAEGQAQIAPQTASAVQLGTNVSGYIPNPQEAKNLLMSGDQRTIALYGGAQKLQQLADQKANAVLAQPPTAQNFISRMQAMAHKYGSIMPNL